VATGTVDGATAVGGHPAAGVLPACAAAGGATTPGGWRRVDGDPGGEARRLAFRAVVINVVPRRVNTPTALLSEG
jgi:hypothetical protein